MRTPRFTLFLAAIFLGGSFSALAQSTTKSGSAARRGSEAWTGVVTYTRTQSQSESKTVDRVSGRGKDTRNWQMKYDYKATVGVIEDPEQAGANIGKASIAHTFTSKETNSAVEKNSCDQGKTWQEMTGTFVSETSINGQGKADANVHIGVNSDGTYSVSVGIPEIRGIMTGSETATFSGQCTPKAGKNRTQPSTPTTIQGHSLSSDGSHRVDPKDPNRLSGSYSLPVVAGVVETISWNLQRHVTPLRLLDVKFEDMKVPQWDNWQEIAEQTGTVDGNWVKIKAVVFNGSSETKTGELVLKETYKGDKWDGARPDAPLKDQTFSLTLAAGEEREVEMVWDTSGHAWYDDGRPRLVQRIKAELSENSNKVDERIRNLKIRPRPIVMVGGIWTDPNGFEIYQNLLTTSHSYDWKAASVTDMSSYGTIAGEGTVAPTAGNRSVYDNASNLNTYVNGLRSWLNAWHIDMLGHGTGGLAARLYVHKQMEVLPDGLPVIKHLMLLGTPNNGVSCADSMSSVPPQTARELAPDEMARFNQHVTGRKGTKFSALAGNFWPILCARPQWNDGNVSVESASHGIEDVTVTSSKHADLLSTENYSNYVRAHVVTGPQGTYPFAGAAKR